MDCALMVLALVRQCYLILLMINVLVIRTETIRLYLVDLFLNNVIECKEDELDICAIGALCIDNHCNCPENLPVNINGACKGNKVSMMLSVLTEIPKL